MKKLLLLLFCATISSVALSQTLLPTKLTKRLNVEKDDFDGSIKYKSEMTGLTVISKKNECQFTWKLNCMDLTQPNFTKVQILVNGNVEEITYAEDEYKEYMAVTRVPMNTFSGGSMAVTFINEDRYFAEIIVDASKYIQLLETIVADRKNTKLRLSGNKDYDGVFDKNKKSEMKTIIEVYKTIMEGKE